MSVEGRKSVENEEKPEWRRWVGPMLPFMLLSAIFVAAFCILVGVALFAGAGSSTVTPTPGLSIEEARDTATAQAEATRDALTRRATPPTRLPTVVTPSQTPTAVVYPYALAEPETFVAHPDGCEWLGVAGEVVDAAGEPVAGLRVHVWGEGIDRVTLSGSAVELGGWEVRLGDAPAVGTYTVQLVAVDDSPLSPAVTFAARDSCDANLARVRFTQTGSE